VCIIVQHCARKCFKSRRQCRWCKDQLAVIGLVCGTLRADVHCEDCILVEFTNSLKVRRFYGRRLQGTDATGSWISYVTLPSLRGRVSKPAFEAISKKTEKAWPWSRFVRRLKRGRTKLDGPCKRQRPGEKARAAGQRAESVWFDPTRTFANITLPSLGSTRFFTRSRSAGAVAPE
jgi:hypothetical protein